jgi:hypothetical protein
MSERKYLLDEHVNVRLRIGLKRKWPEMVVWRVGDTGAPPLHSLDPDILVWCELNGFSLITNNRSSMPVHLADHLNSGRHVPGIFVLNADMSIGETIDELGFIWAATDLTEYFDLLNYLPIRY